MNDFCISYEIPLIEWRRTAALRFVETEEPMGDLFEGIAEVKVNGTNILGGEPYPISIANLAIECAHMLAHLQRDSRGSFRLHQLEDGLQITFQRQEEFVVLQSNAAPGTSWRIAWVALDHGVSDFCSQFAGEITRHIPDGLEWKQLKHLRRFLGVVPV